MKIEKVERKIEPLPIDFVITLTREEAEALVGWYPLNARDIVAQFNDLLQRKLIEK